MRRSEPARYAPGHDVAEGRAADLVIGQQPAVVSQGKHCVRGGRVLRIAPRLEIHYRGLDTVLILRRLDDFSRELRDVRTRA